MKLIKKEFNSSQELFKKNRFVPCVLISTLISFFEMNLMSFECHISIVLPKIISDNDFSAITSHVSCTSSSLIQFADALY